MSVYPLSSNAGLAPLLTMSRNCDVRASRNAQEAHERITGGNDRLTDEGSGPTGIDRPRAEVASFDLTETDIRAAKKITKHLPQTFSIEGNAKAAKKRFARAEKAKRQSRHQTRLAIQKLYSIYAKVLTDRNALADLDAACTREQAKLHLRKKDPPICVVALYGGIADSERRYRFANVLRELLRREVPSQKVAAYLEEPGHGIDKLHKAHQRRDISARPIEPSHPSKKAKTDQAATVGTPALRPPRKTKTDQAGSGRAPSLRLAWTKKTMERYEQARIGSALWIKIIKNGDGTVEARKVCRHRSIRNKDGRAQRDQQAANAPVRKKKLRQTSRNR
jgi:hypothetical protein